MRQSLSTIIIGISIMITGLWACGDDNGKPQPCDFDGECSIFGEVCQGEVCSVLPCDTRLDCLNGDQACVSIGGQEQKVCALAECGCINCSECIGDEVCVNGLCQNAVACDAANPCEGTDICDAGICRSCEGDECTTPAGCSETGCPAGQVCDAVTDSCVDGGGQDTSLSCQACEEDPDCGQGGQCTPLPSGKACLYACTSADDCDTGWSCQAGVCTPPSHRCEGCHVTGCDAGQACNAQGSCVPAKDSCDSCVADWECGEGSACRNGECAPRCDNGICADGGTCAPNASGISVCQTPCTVECAETCGGSTPHCVNGACVQCAGPNDCPTGQTCNAQNQCVSGGTTEPDTECDQDCRNPYPVCIKINEDHYCVQCQVDEDCGVGGVCNPSTYACTGGVVTDARCETDNDCDSGALTGFNLRCDKRTNLCYDQGGQCDDVTAFCPNTKGAVTECISPFAFMEDMLGGGAGLPDLGDLGDGMTIPGACACDLGLLGGFLGGAEDTCLGGSCGADFMSMLGGLFGGGGGLEDLLDTQGTCGEGGGPL